MYFTPIVAQTVTQVSDTIERINNTTALGLAFVAMATTLAALFLLGMFVRAIIPALAQLNTTGAALAESSRGATAQNERSAATTERVATELKTNNAATLQTKEIVGEIKTMVGTTNDNTAATANDIAAIKKDLDTFNTTLTKLTQDVGKLADDTSANTSATTEVVSVVQELRDKLTAAIGEANSKLQTLLDRQPPTVSVAVETGKTEG